MKTIFSKINGETFLILYKSYILPILELNNLSFTPNRAQTIALEKVQKKRLQNIFVLS
jgi:hypothetical protein